MPPHHLLIKSTKTHRLSHHRETNFPDLLLVPIKQNPRPHLLLLPHLRLCLFLCLCLLLQELKRNLLPMFI
ncbi:hypothetical protein AALP_AA8G375500 [Arabis alpina]|uniref:Uncharacterized protein n=1 Tax=Arabis alpina TaxID=50452 RepID=A0A087GBY0_ARAAL|nr:hypothetical protein AALP_AA8G375500 [Arabis alpina]